MCHGNHKLYVAHALTTHFLLSNLHTATFAHDTLVAYSLILSTMALIILYGTEYALAEQTVTLRLVCTIVNGFRLEDLTA
jgi:hypothetical protein